MRRVIVVVACAIAACGGPGDAPDALEFEHRDTHPQSVCGAASTSDGETLALRNQSGIRLAVGLARDYAWALEEVRVVYPELCDTHAAEHAERDTMLVEPVLHRISTAWRAGEAHTGITDLDTILDQVGVSAISGFEHFDLFKLTLAQPVNARVLADAVNATGTAVAYPNTIGQLEGQTSFTPFAHDLVIEATEGGVMLSVFHDRGRCAVTVGYDGSVGEKEKR